MAGGENLASRLVVGAARGLEAQLLGLAVHRMVFFAGLPGTGKSLMVHQLAHLAVEAGRRAHRLQWDVARPVFEASRAGQRYPLVDGVTHTVIRKAAGLWVREAIVAWNDRYPGPEHLLIGETPFVGGRFVELARVVDDPAEALLTGPSCRFALPVPSAQVRRFLEAERERRAARPRHPREREDAPPAVLRSLWRELQEVGRQLGLAVAESDYDPVVYRRVFEAVLRHRHVDIVALDVILPTATVSVYDFAVSAPDLTPTEGEAETWVDTVERRYADRAVLAHELEHWWRV